MAHYHQYLDRPLQVMARMRVQLRRPSTRYTHMPSCHASVDLVYNC